jgi:DNA replication protein DnaC
LSAWYVRAPRLFEELNLCHADGSFRKRLAAIAKINLIVIDDFAISPLGPRERNDLLELLDDRIGCRASIVTSQLPIEHWHEYLNDPTVADAILDRLVHLQDFPLRDRLISRVGDHLRGVTGGAVDEDC